MDIPVIPDSRDMLLGWLVALYRRLYRARRKLATLGAGLLALWLGIHVVSGANGMMVYQQKRAEYRQLQKEIELVQQENQGYAQQIKALKSDPKTIEKEAREQLRYARPGEVVYVAPPDRPPDHPPTRSAQK